MSIVRYTKKQAREEYKKALASVDWAKVNSCTEEDVKRFVREDDSDTSQLGEPRYVPPKVDLRALREKLGFSQAEFARRYLLSVRTVQQWEQTQREPSDAARAFLYAISRDPQGIERALRGNVGA
jgi:putative transcriptional regulator